MPHIGSSPRYPVLIPAIILLVLWAPTAVPAAAEAPGDTASARTATAPVVLDGEVLFVVRGVSARPAEERARSIAERIGAVAADAGVSPASLRVVDTEGRSEIRAGDRLVVTIVDADARAEEVDRHTLALTNLGRIRLAIENYRRDRSPEYLRRAAALSGGATLGLAVACLVVLYLGRRLDRALDRRLQRRITSIAIQSFEVVQAKRIFAAVHRLFDGVRLVVVLGLVLLWASYVLVQFPWTREAGRLLLVTLRRPLAWLGSGFLTSLPDLVFLAILFVVVRWGLGLLFLFFDAVDRGTVRLRSFDREWAWPTHRIVRMLIVAFAVVVAFPYIPGSGSEAFRGISIFLGVVFSLGATGLVANILAGYTMIYRRTFKVGDRVKIGGVVGDVTEMRLQVTHLRSPKNEEIIVPNSEILGGEVVNYSSYARQGQLILHATVGIGYEVPWRQVEAMLLLAAERTEGLLREPPPFVHEKALGDFAVTYEINVYCDDAQTMPKRYAALHRHILDVFNEYGVQIMTPAYEGDPEQPKVVPRARWFDPPARQDER